jgi:hypothetical protein
MECQFCKNTLKNKYSLLTHQKTNKKCLEEQKKKNNVIENKLTNCMFCEKSYSIPNLKSHLLVCKKKKKFDIEKEYEKKFEEIRKEYEMKNKENQKEIRKEYERKIEEIQNENERKIEEIQNENERKILEIQNENERKILEIQNEKKILEIQKENERKILEIQNENCGLRKELEIKDEIYKDEHKTIKKLALQPKSTTNNIIGNLNLDDTKRIKDILEKEFTPNDILDGQKGLANFAFKNILRDEYGNLVYVCGDSARKIFKYKDSLGKIIKDVNTQKLTDAFIMSDISTITNAKSQEFWINEDGTQDHTKYNIISNPAAEIMNLKYNNVSFREQLVNLTSS